MALRLAIAFVCLWFSIGDVAHFAFTETKMLIVPPYASWPREPVLVSGTFELLGTADLLWPRPAEALRACLH